MRTKIEIDFPPQSAAMMKLICLDHGITPEQAVIIGIQMLVAARDAAKEGLTVGAFGVVGRDLVRVERRFINQVTTAPKIKLALPKSPIPPLA